MQATHQPAIELSAMNDLFIEVSGGVVEDPRFRELLRIGLVTRIETYSSDVPLYVVRAQTEVVDQVRRLSPGLLPVIMGNHELDEQGEECNLMAGCFMLDPSQASESGTCDPQLQCSRIWKRVWSKALFAPVWGPVCRDLIAVPGECAAYELSSRTFTVAMTPAYAALGSKAVELAPGAWTNGLARFYGSKPRWMPSPL